MRKQFSPLMALAFFCFFSCAKTEQSAADQPPNNTPGGVDVSKENLVGSYRITKVEAGSGTQRSDVTEMWFDTYAGDCAKDDVTTFNPDESFVVQDGTVTCDESTDDTGTWKIA